MFAPGCADVCRLLVVAAFSVGSANMDWRSLTQVKEFGIYFPDAPTVASELVKVFEQYWILGTKHAIPAQWPASLETAYTIESPMRISMNGTESDLFFSLSPPPAQPKSWSLDSEAITHAMFAAEDFIWIEVMDYMPAQIYVEPQVYWNTIDNAIRKASYKYVCTIAPVFAAVRVASTTIHCCKHWVLDCSNKTEVRLLIGYWEHSIPVQQNYVQSLNALPNVTVKYFIVPRMWRVQCPACNVCTWLTVALSCTEYKVNIPYTRVNHAKWMVTDKQLFIDTSNWYVRARVALLCQAFTVARRTGDYFTNTAGVGTNTNNVAAQRKGVEVFLRDWNSEYTHDIPPSP